ncbi:unnamed protein product [Lactuca saligna]|uniref:Uncharacterized protein n=1 Tax=Lactuca saligna TaxID=75948 RepID=A0AA35Z4P8_LACSI|nr:unnamed protein product [Lactuca saligna]
MSTVLRVLGARRIDEYTPHPLTHNIARHGRQSASQLPPHCPSHPFLEFPDDLPDRSSFVSCPPALLSKKTSNPQALSWIVADNSGLTDQLGPFLTHVLWDNSGLEVFFFCHGLQLVVGVREVVYTELLWEFFLTVRFNKASMRWDDKYVFTFFLGGVSCSYSLIEMGRHLGIYTAEETLSPSFYGYLDSCFTDPP